MPMRPCRREPERNATAGSISSADNCLSKAAKSAVFSSRLEVSETWRDASTMAASSIIGLSALSGVGFEALVDLNLETAGQGVGLIGHAHYRQDLAHHLLGGAFSQRARGVRRQAITALIGGADS